MIEDEYYVKCFKKEMEKYSSCLYKHTKKMYGHLYSDEQIATLVYNDAVEMFNKISFDLGVKINLFR